MMSNSDINKSAGQWPKGDGRTVPEGYFDDFARRMMEKLPEQAVPEMKPRRSTWQIIRPYVYMAAMFAGVYLLMNIFTLTTGVRNAVSSPDSSSLLAELVNPSTSSYVEEYLNVSDPFLYDDLFEAGFEIPDNI